MSQIEVKVPDIGDFDQVDVIEILVKEGDTIAQEDSLITVESDKASMEIPSSYAGKVTELKVKVGDKVAEGSLILMLEAQEDQAAQESPDQAPAEEGADSQTTRSDDASAADAKADAQSNTEAAASATKQQSSSASSQTPATSAAEHKAEPIHFENLGEDAYDVVVIGSGPGGYSAAFRAADLGLKVALIERYSTLGGVCLNVGCIPSKALLHNVQVLEEAKHLAAKGIRFSEPDIDLDKLRDAKNQVIGKLTGGLASMAKMRKVTVVTGTASFSDEHHLNVQLEDGKTQDLAFHACIIAAGSESVKLPFLPEDKRIVDSTGALELRQNPQKMLIIGGGIIGLEMATVYSALGARLDVVEMQDGVMQGADRDLVKAWQKKNADRFDHIWVNTKTVAAEAKDDGIYVSFEGADAPKEPQKYDLVLQAVGRKPNGKNIGAEKAGVEVTDRGFIEVDTQMRTNVAHIFAIGDIVGQPMLAHKAVHEAHVAAEVIAGHKAGFDARVIPSVAYTHPEVAWAGITEEQAKAQGVKLEKALFPWAASGRAIANDATEGFTKLLFDAETKRILGGSIVGLNAGDLISEVALAIEMGADIDDMAHTIHPHPTLGESVGMAAEVAAGSCTDVPPAKKR
ncbi:dihydrolipoyl dehydrogenase [Brackiella oedipodis]|uniref:dihydrolipoyl dehydrogenase n=1 Tax=Brackiella oedipodis TaxID=124225 RepID=UPI000490DAEE|nr:dihydrolipoyl dehydrogenase [Brackiella oedipodis]